MDDEDFVPSKPEKKSRPKRAGAGSRATDRRKESRWTTEASSSSSSNSAAGKSSGRGGLVSPINALVPVENSLALSPLGGSSSPVGGQGKNLAVLNKALKGQFSTRAGKEKNAQIKPRAKTERKKGLAKKKSEGYSRKDKSLGLLCEKFLKLYEGTGNENVTLDSAAQQLAVERRRIYDIVNILEAVEIVSRKGKNEYTWHGTTRLEGCLDRLQLEADGSARLKALAESIEKEDTSLVLKIKTKGGRSRSRSSSPAMRGSSSSQQSPKTERKRTSRKKGSSKAREQSLGHLSQIFVQMFLLSQTRVISLEDAARSLLAEDPQSDLNNKDLDQKEIDKAHSTFKSKVRRLYDIANVLTSLSLIEKIHLVETRKPAFKWLGADVYPLESTVDPEMYTADTTAYRPSEKRKADEEGSPSRPSKRQKTEGGGSRMTTRSRSPRGPGSSSSRAPRYDYDLDDDDDGFNGDSDDGGSVGGRLALDETDAQAIAALAGASTMQVLNQLGHPSGSSSSANASGAGAATAQRSPPHPPNFPVPHLSPSGLFVNPQFALPTSARSLSFKHDSGSSSSSSSSSATAFASPSRRPPISRVKAVKAEYDGDDPSAAPDLPMPMMTDTDDLDYNEGRPDPFGNRRTPSGRIPNVVMSLPAGPGSQPSQSPHTSPQLAAAAAAAASASSSSAPSGSIAALHGIDLSAISGWDLAYLVGGGVSPAPPLPAPARLPSPPPIPVSIIHNTLAGVPQVDPPLLDRALSREHSSAGFGGAGAGVGARRGSSFFGQPGRSSSLDALLGGLQQPPQQQQQSDGAQPVAMDLSSDGKDSASSLGRSSSTLLKRALSKPKAVDRDEFLNNFSAACETWKNNIQLFSRLADNHLREIAHPQTGASSAVGVAPLSQS